MKLVTTTNVLAPYVCGRSVAEPLSLLAQTPFRHVDLSFYSIIYPGSPWLAPGDGWKKEIEDCAEAAVRYGFDFRQAHSPDGEHFAPGEKRDALLLATSRTLEACRMLSIPHTVIHAASTPPDFDRFVPDNVAFYRLFADESEKYGVDMLTENTGSLWNPEYRLFTGAQMADFVRAAGIPRLHVCWDTGHANSEGRNQYEDVLALGPELRALHVQDNMGAADLHLTPGMGTVNFDRLLEGLRAIGYTGDFTLEDGSTLRRTDLWPAYRQFNKDGDKLGKMPPAIAVKAASLSYDIARFMVESYGYTAE